MDKYCYKYSSDGRKLYYIFDIQLDRYRRVTSNDIPKDELQNIKFCNIMAEYDKKYKLRRLELERRKQKLLRELSHVETILSSINVAKTKDIRYELSNQRVNQKKFQNKHDVIEPSIEQFEGTSPEDLPEGASEGAYQTPPEDTSEGPAEHPREKFSYPKAHVVRETFTRNKNQTEKPAKPANYGKSGSNNHYQPSNFDKTFNFADQSTYGNAFSFDGFFSGESTLPNLHRFRSEILYLQGFGINSKSDWKKWSVKNHPDKNPDNTIPINEVNAAVTKLTSEGIESW